MFEEHVVEKIIGLLTIVATIIRIIIGLYQLAKLRKQQKQGLPSISIPPKVSSDYILLDVQSNQESPNDSLSSAIHEFIKQFGIDKDDEDRIRGFTYRPYRIYDMRRFYYRLSIRSGIFYWLFTLGLVLLLIFYGTTVDTINSLLLTVGVLSIPFLLGLYDFHQSRKHFKKMKAAEAYIRFLGKNNIVTGVSMMRKKASINDPIQN